MDLRAPGSSPIPRAPLRRRSGRRNSAGHRVGRVVREISHVVLHFLLLRKPSAVEKAVKTTGTSPLTSGSDLRALDEYVGGRYDGFDHENERSPSDGHQNGSGDPFRAISNRALDCNFFLPRSPLWFWPFRSFQVTRRNLGEWMNLALAADRNRARVPWRMICPADSPPRLYRARW